MTTRTDTLHDALDRLSAYAYTDNGGFACHGPMGAEALSALGHDELVPRWIDQYVAHHPPDDAPPARSPIDGSDEAEWRGALGDFARVGDWAQLFQRQLATEPWEDVLRTWLPRLFPGFAGGLTHGLLRTAHAVRMIDGTPDPSPWLQAELAAGLASWAAWHKPLPGRPLLRGDLDLAHAMAALPQRGGPWSPGEAGTFARLGEVTDFPAAVERLGPPDPSADPLSGLSIVASRMALANPSAPPIGLVHAITPIAATRTLLPLAGPMTVVDVYRQLWHVLAAVTVAFADQRPTPRSTPDGDDDITPPTPQELVTQAAGHPEAHVIKVTEACLREHAHDQDPVHLAAAGALVDRINGA